ALDQAPRQQALLAEVLGDRFVDPIKLLRREALTVNREGLGRLALHAERQLERGDPGVERAVDDSRPLMQLVESPETIKLLALTTGIAERVSEVLDGVVQVLDPRPLIGGRQEARAPQRGARWRRGRADHDEAGQTPVLAAQAVDQPGAEARPGERLLARV